MKILKLLNKKNLSIVIFSLFSFSSFAEDKPVDIWNIEKQETENISEENLSIENKQVVSESSVYKMQSDKNEDSIKLDQDLTSKTIKISLVLIVILVAVFLLNKIDFPAPKKEIEKIVPNENFKIVK